MARSQNRHKHTYTHCGYNQSNVNSFYFLQGAPLPIFVMMTLMITSIVTAAAVDSMEINTAADGLLISFEVHRVYCLWRVRSSMV